MAVGQLVFAEFKGGWHYATVLSVRGGICDVSWRRPQAANWGRDSVNPRYLCSTGADETLHGEGIPVQTRIRLTAGPKIAAAAEAAATSPAAARAAPVAGPADLLGEEAPAPGPAPAEAAAGAGSFDLLG